jgi:hypothetical protein
MANILQVTSPEVTSPNIRTGVGQGQGAGQVGGAGQVRGPLVSDTPVSQGENPELAQLAGQIVDFESNYSAFLNRLQGADNVPQQLAQLLFRDGTQMLQSDDAELAGAMQDLYATFTMESPEELMTYLQSQADGQMKFSGDFFTGLRTLMNSNIPDQYREVISRFLQTYNSYSSGTHLLSQMQTLSQDVDNLLLKSWRGEFEQMTGNMNWTASNGDTKANASVLNNQIIPFLSDYVSKTHDYGAIRKAAVMFSLYAVKYEEGSSEALTEAFRKMARNGDFRMIFGDDAEEQLASKLAEIRTQDGSTNFSKAFSEVLLKGTQGRIGTDSESIDRYYQVLNSLLTNESVYMPILHMLIPFRYQNQNVMSEMWVNPDADKDQNQAKGVSGQDRKVKLFLKFHIEKLGNFDMVAMLKDHSVSMQLYIPDTVPEKPARIESTVRDILRRNGFSGEVQTAPKTREISPEEIFPEIAASERSINVRV